MSFPIGHSREGWQSFAEYKDPQKQTWCGWYKEHCGDSWDGVDVDPELLHLIQHNGDTGKRQHRTRKKVLPLPSSPYPDEESNRAYEQAKKPSRSRLPQDPEWAMRLRAAIAEAGNTFVGPDGERIDDLGERWAELRPWPGYPDMSRRFYYWYQARAFGSANGNYDYANRLFGHPVWIWGTVLWRNKPRRLFEMLFEKLYKFNPNSEGRIQRAKDAWKHEPGFPCQDNPELILTPAGFVDPNRTRHDETETDKEGDALPDPNTHPDSKEPRALTHKLTINDEVIERSLCTGRDVYTKFFLMVAILARGDSLSNGPDVYMEPYDGWDVSSSRNRDRISHRYRMWCKQGRIAEVLDVREGDDYLPLCKWTGPRNGEEPTKDPTKETVRGYTEVAGGVLVEAGRWRDIQNLIAQKVAYLKEEPVTGAMWALRKVRQDYELWAARLQAVPVNGDCMPEQIGWNRLYMLAQLWRNQDAFDAMNRAGDAARAAGHDIEQACKSALGAYAKIMKQDYFADVVRQTWEFLPEVRRETLSVLLGGDYAVDIGTSQNKRLAAALVGQPGGLLAVLPDAALIAEFDPDVKDPIIAYEPRTTYKGQPIPPQKRKLNYAAKILEADQGPAANSVQDVSYTDLGWDNGEPPDDDGDEDQAFDGRGEDDGGFYGEILEKQPEDYDAAVMLDWEPIDTNTPGVKQDLQVIGAAAMTPQQKQIVELRLQGMSYKAIAAQLGITTGAVSKQLSRAKEAIVKTRQNSPVILSTNGLAECIVNRGGNKALSFLPSDRMTTAHGGNNHETGSTEDTAAGSGD